MHKEFDGILESGGGGSKVSGETSYLNGSHDGRYRPKDSSNPYAIMGDIVNPNAAFDLKTGKSGISNTQMNKYNRNLPKDTPVYTIRPDGHDVTRPTTYTGVGAATNTGYMAGQSLSDEQ